MKIVIAMDSFKGSLASPEAGAAVRRGILRAIPGAEICVLPFADGGEGTVEAILSANGGGTVSVEVTGPLGEPVTARYGRAGNTAVIEMAQAAGLPLVPLERRNPMNTTSRGVGEMIAHAAASGCRDFLVGIGGSATNDGGMGMLSALGVHFYGLDGELLPGYGRDLAEIASVDSSGLLPVLRECRFRVACDVDNPLCGPRGASAVFGPQKGLSPAGVVRMDEAMQHYAEITITNNKYNYVNYEGAGAAGGLGFAFLSYLNAELVRGADMVLDAINFASYVRDADYFVTGEGRMDAQTSMGKAPARAAAAAKSCGAVTLGFAGSVCTLPGVEFPCIDAVFSVQPGPVSLSEAMEPAVAANNLANAAEQVFRLICCIK